MNWCRVLWGLFWVLSGCASPALPPLKEKQDAGHAQDAAACRSEAGLNEVGRNDPQAYRAQALYNRCMRYRGWPGE